MISGSRDSTLKVWDLHSGKVKFTLGNYRYSVSAVAVTGDGKYVISGSRDSTLKVWDLQSGKVKFTLRGYRYSVNAVVVTSDGKYVISGSNDSTLKVWDLHSGKQKLTLSGHSDWVNAVAVASDGKYVISASHDATLKVWDLQSGKEIATFTGETDIECCAVAPDGVTIVAGERSGRLHFLRLQGIEGVTMNTPSSQIAINFASYPREFQQVILEKSQNFIDRTFIFTAINEFLHHHNRGYFTIVGVPGSGKSAILAKYVTENSNVVYYNAQVEGKNRAEEFLKDVCTQLIEWLHSASTPPQPSPQARREEDFPPFTGGVRGVLPDNATEGSWFLSLLLQKISDKLEPPQRLIIAIDALDAIDRNSQPLGTNLFYLPRYLPNGIYFILTRRPFKREKSGLLIEVPSQILDLSEYSEQNWDNVPSFIQHWQKMKQEGLSDVALKVLRVLTSASKGGMSASAIAQIIDEDEYEVEEVLENWLEFLVQQRIDTKTNYSFYHANFRNWLAGRLSNGKIE